MEGENNINHSSSDNSRYKVLIKRIAKKLKKRMKLPKCKIFKFHCRYRALVLRIAKGIKNNAKKMKLWEKWGPHIDNNKNNRFIIQHINDNSIQFLKQGNNNSQRQANLSGMKNNNDNFTLKISKIILNSCKKGLENMNQSNNDPNIEF